MTSALESLHRLALALYRRLPTAVRRWVIRAVAPKYTVGAICVIERADGRLLLVRQTYREQWGLPGGLVKRGEAPADAARREVLEETGLAVELLGEPAVVVAPGPQRVDVVYRARPADELAVREVRACTPEIRDVRWCDREELPPVQAETAGALVALARSAHSPQAPPMSPSPWSVRRAED